VAADYHFTDIAEKDLQNIINYTLNRWGTSQANRYINDLATELAKTPKMGQSRQQQTCYHFHIKATYYITLKDLMALLLFVFYTRKWYLKNIWV